MPSVPTSDGLNHLAHPSGQSPEIANHTSLTRSVSASVCPAKPSDPDSLEPKTVKALKALPEFQITSEKRDLSDHASSADQSPTMPLKKSSKESVVADNLKKSPAENSTHGLKIHLYTRQETSLSVTTTGMREPQMFLSEEGWHREYQNLSQVNELQHHEEAGSQRCEPALQSAPDDQEHVCNTGDLGLPTERQQNRQKCVVEDEMKGDRLQQNVDLLGAEKKTLPAGCIGCSNSETLMEVDTVKQSPVAVFNSPGSQNASVEDIGASELMLDNPLMEVETSECNPSSEILSNSISTQDLQLPESNVEVSRTDKEYSICSPSLTVCGSCQPSVESMEESYSSITTALKELHELLVTSSNPASENTSEEFVYQSEIGAEGQQITTTKDLSELGTPSEPLTATQEERDPQVSSPQALLVLVNTEKLTDTSPGTGVEDVEKTNIKSPGGGLCTDEKGVPKSRDSVRGSSSVLPSSAKTSNQLRCTPGNESSPKLVAGKEDAVCQASEQTKSVPFNFVLVKDLGRCTQNPMTDNPETREDVYPEAASPFHEFEPPTSHPLVPSILPPLIFPAADIDRILHAGFTLPEALGALHQVGGNADLALLVLLAKNIVVPT